MAACLSSIAKRTCNNNTHHLLVLAKTLNPWNQPHKLERIQAMSYRYSRKGRHLQVSKGGTMKRAATSSNNHISNNNNLVVTTLRQQPAQCANTEPLRFSIRLAPKIKGSSSGTYYGFQEVSNLPNVVDSPFVTEVSNLEKQEGCRGVANARFATSVIRTHLRKKVEFERILRYQTQRYGGEYHCFVIEAVHGSKSEVYHAVVREASPMKPQREVCCWSYMHGIPISKRSNIVLKQAKVANSKNQRFCQSKEAEEIPVALPQTTTQVRTKDDSAQSCTLRYYAELILGPIMYSIVAVLVIRCFCHYFEIIKRVY